MAENSGIAWTTHTFNPWIGCTKVGPGCDHCYAEAWNKRFAGGPDGDAPNWGPGALRRRTRPQNWGRVRKWNREAEGKTTPTWVFCASLADVFDNEADPKDRADLFDLIHECSNLEFQIVTKRIGNAADMLPDHIPANMGLISTVVTQAECDRDLPKLELVKLGFGVSWIGLSVEPQLGAVIPETVGSLDWVITGGESAQGGKPARVYDPDWAEFLIDAGARDGYEVFVKQMGSNPLGLKLKAGHGDDPTEWDASLRVRQFPREPLIRHGWHA